MNESLAVVVTLVAQTIRMAIPYGAAAVGGVWSERSGVVNIALEGMLLAAGLAAVVAQHATGSAAAGVAAGLAAGAAMGLVHALLVVRGRIDAIVSGIALNLAASGGTRFVLRALYDSRANSPRIEGFHFDLGASAWALLFEVLLDPLTLAAIAIVAASTWTISGTRFGLRVRACGEDPSAAASTGISVARVRLAAVSLGGAICGLGGVALAFDQHQFQSGMSGGRGFIALAAVVLSGWRPKQAAAACLAFAALDALQIVLQDRVKISPYAVQMLPYVATLFALLLIAARRRTGAIAGRPPAGLGRHE